MHRLLHEAINRFCTICPLSCRPVRPRSLVVELGGVSGRCKEQGDVGARSGRDPLGVLLDQFDLDQRFKGTIQALILQYRPPVAGQRTAGGAKQETLTCHRAIIRRQLHKRREGKGEKSSMRRTCSVVIRVGLICAAVGVLAFEPSRAQEATGDDSRPKEAIAFRLYRWEENYLWLSRRPIR